MKFDQKNQTFKQNNKTMPNVHNHLLDIGVEFDVVLIKVDENRTWEFSKSHLMFLKRYDLMIVVHVGIYQV